MMRGVAQGFRATLGWLLALHIPHHDERVLPQARMHVLAPGVNDLRVAGFDRPLAREWQGLHDDSRSHEDYGDQWQRIAEKVSVVKVCQLITPPVIPARPQSLCP
jgi:hypothetical protein